MSKLLDALKKKYKTPAEAVRALGLDAALLDGDSPAPITSGGRSNRMEITMSNKKYLSRKAAMAKGVLRATLAPRLAQDANIDLNPLLVGVKASNWNASKQSIVAALKSEKNTKFFKDKMAQDAAVEDVIRLLNSMDGEELGEKPDVNLGKDLDPDQNLEGTEFKGGTGMSKDASKEQIMALISAHLSPEDLAKVEHLLKALGEDDLEISDPEGDEVEILEKLLAKLRGEGAQDEGDIGKGAPLNIPAKPGTSMPTPKQPAAVDRAAMDAAIKAAVTSAEKRTVERMNAMEEARKAVKPFVGKVMGMDSAEAIYKLALDAAGVDLEGVPTAAYKAMVAMLPKPGERTNDGGLGKRLGMDGDAASGAAKQFSELFPAAGRVKHL